MKHWHLSMAWGFGFTVALFATAAGLFGLSDHLSAPYVAQIFFGLAVIAVIPIIPGSLLGRLAFNIHSAVFLILTAIGDVVFYSFIAHGVLEKRLRHRDEWGQENRRDHNVQSPEPRQSDD